MDYRECGKNRRKRKFYKRVTSGTNQCIKCKIDKDVSEFYSSRYKQNGLHSYCKRCSTKRRKYARIISGTKQCYRCKIEKDVSEFDSHKQNKNGLQSYCKECRKECRKGDKPSLHSKHGLSYHGSCIECVRHLLDIIVPPS